MKNHLDPAGAAYFALIAICLVLIGALLTPGQVTIDQRAAVLAGIGTVLLVIARYGRRRGPRLPPDDGDDDA